MEKYKLALKLVAKEICDDRCVCGNGGGKCRHDYEYEAGKAIAMIAKLVKQGRLDLDQVPADEQG